MILRQTWGTFGHLFEGSSVLQSRERHLDSDFPGWITLNILKMLKHNQSRVKGIWGRDWEQIIVPFSFASRHQIIT